MFKHLNGQRVLFDPFDDRVRPLSASVDERKMAMKEYSAFPKLQGWNLTIRLFGAILGTVVAEGGAFRLQKCSWCFLQPQPTEKWTLRLAKMNSQEKFSCGLLRMDVPVLADGWLWWMTRERERVRKLCNVRASWWWWCWCIWIYLPLHTSKMRHKVNFLKQTLRGLNSEFSFSQTSYHTTVKEPSLLYYLPIAEEGIVASYKQINILLTGQSD